MAETGFPPLVWKGERVPGRVVWCRQSRVRGGWVSNGTAGGSSRSRSAGGHDECGKAFDREAGHFTAWAVEHDDSVVYLVPPPPLIRFDAVDAVLDVAAKAPRSVSNCRLSEWAAVGADRLISGRTGLQPGDQRPGHVGSDGRTPAERSSRRSRSRYPRWDHSRYRERDRRGDHQGRFCCRSSADAGDEPLVDPLTHLPARWRPYFADLGSALDVLKTRPCRYRRALERWATLEPLLDGLSVEAIFAAPGALSDPQARALIRTARSSDPYADLAAWTLIWQFSFTIIRIVRAAPVPGRHETRCLLPWPSCGA
jgi:hypothetical protein